jgi:hypothetical protein
MNTHATNEALQQRLRSDHFVLYRCSGARAVDMRRYYQSTTAVPWGTPLAASREIKPPSPGVVKGRHPCTSNDGPRLLREWRLVLLFTNLLAIALPRQRFLHALLLTWFQIKRVTLDFLDDVFSLHFTLEATQGILKGFAFLNSNLCQKKYTSKQSQSGML